MIDAPVSIAKAEDPARAVRANPDASIVAAVARGRRRPRPTRSSPAARPAPRWPPRCSASSAAAGIHRPALAVLVPVPGSPFLLLDAGANVEVRPEHLVQFAHMGAAFMETAMGVSRPRVALLSNGEEADQGPRGPRRRPRGARRLGLAAELRRQRRGLRDRHRRGRRDRHRRLHRQRRAEGDGGRRRPCCSARSARRRPRRRARRSAACCCGPALRELRDQLDPQAVGGAVLLGLRKLVVVPHGSFEAAGITNAIAARRARRARGRGGADARDARGRGRAAARSGGGVRRGL